MFKNLSEFFAGEVSLKIDANGEPTRRDLIVSAVVVLNGLAHADNDFETEELNSIMNQMFAEFELSQNEGAEILAIAQFLQRDQSKIDQFIDTLNANFTIEQKQLILAMAWKLIIADGVVEKFESELAVELRGKLGLSLEQAVRARQMAELNQVALASARTQRVGVSPEEE